MTKKSNFKKAYSELASMVGIDTAPVEDVVTAPPVPLETATPSPERSVEDLFATMVETPVHKPTPSIPVTTIGSDAVINGDISGGSLEIFGTVTGNVTAKGSLLIRGTINGNVTADSITVESGAVTAEMISATDKVEIAAGTNLHTNIQCGSLALYATLKGNVSVTGNVVLYNTAVIEGNIKAASISVASGASIKGLVDISK